MEGLDVEATEDDTFWEPDAEPLPGDPTSSKAYSTVMISRIAFLKLLVRLRRVILQDAVLYMKPNKNGQTLTNNLLASLPHIFESRLFLDFQSELLNAIEDHRKKTDLINPNVQVDRQTMVQAINSLHDKVNKYQSQNPTNELLSKLSELQQQLQQIQALLLQSLPQFQQPQQPREQQQIQQIQQLQQLQELQLQQLQQQLQSQPRPQVQIQQPPLIQQQQCLPHSDPGTHSPLVTPQINQTFPASQYIHFIPPGNNNLLSVQPQQQMSQVSRRPLANRGNLTVREAWDEFHGPMTLEKRHGVMGRAQKKAYSRRELFVDMIKADIKERHLPEDIILDEWTERYRGRTINSIRESILKEKSSEKGKMVDRGEKDDEVEE
ncbi:hypothetical protein BGZ49_007508 [Haplosporangium sp. Z 27]|nr:hypothetical protein BGZ49_007508 [Haplosporangium sp. Z 27]